MKNRTAMKQKAYHAAQMQKKHKNNRAYKKITHTLSEEINSAFDEMHEVQPIFSGRPGSRSMLDMVSGVAELTKARLEDYRKRKVLFNQIKILFTSHPDLGAIAGDVSDYTTSVLESHFKILADRVAVKTTLEAKAKEQQVAKAN